MLALTVAFNSFDAESQENNNAPVAAACRLVACILHNPNLTTLYLGHEPPACVGHAAWQGEGLPVPPSEVAAKGWTAVLEFLRKAKAVGCEIVNAWFLGTHAFFTCQAEEKYKRLMSAAPGSTLDCSGLFDSKKLIDVIEKAATRIATLADARTRSPHQTASQAADEQPGSQAAVATPRVHGT